MTQFRYKLLNRNMTSHGGCVWKLNEWKETDGNASRLCNKSWLHCYSHPLIAAFFNVIHAHIDTPLLFKCEVDGKFLDDNGCKEGWTRMRIVEAMDLPVVSTSHFMRFALLCAKEVIDNPSFLSWANHYLDNCVKPFPSLSLEDVAHYYAVIDKILIYNNMIRYQSSVDNYYPMIAVDNSVIAKSDNPANPANPRIDLISLAQKAIGE